MTEQLLTASNRLALMTSSLGKSRSVLCITMCELWLVAEVKY